MQMMGDTTSEMNKYYGNRGSIMAGSTMGLSLRSTASKNPASRKDSNEEFFKMSLLSFKLNHPKQA
jgi:hypothetical protein